jgi:hypothetical protein
MIRLPAIVLLAFLTAACKQPAARPSITQFKATPSFLPAGIAGKLCYGVENAARLQLTPAVEKVLPASERCIDIAPKQTTTYTLIAWGKDGNEEKKSLEVKVGPPAPRLSNLAASSTRIKRGAPVKICFKVENANSVTGKPGKLDRRTNCLTDRPRKTTTYKITALGQNHEEDSGTVTVNVGR